MQASMKRNPRSTPFIRSTDEEQAAITAAALSDPDALPSTPEELAQFTRRRGRPPSDVTKVAISLRLDLDILNAFKMTGQGWQTRINDALRDYVESHDMRGQRES
ncbi:uncharacterized protein (DUF4415 family) [Janthinobacterium sp. CG_23.3]|nr:uncharacterized protein (DUF4415 family) [Janthinobacterium sp. CG_S6]